MSMEAKQLTKEKRWGPPQIEDADPDWLWGAKKVFVDAKIDFVPRWLPPHLRAEYH